MSEKESTILFDEKDVYSKVSEVLAREYYTIFIVNLDTDDYIEFHPSDTFKKVDAINTGKNYFEESQDNVKRVVHPDDQDKVSEVLNRNNLMRLLQLNTAIYVTYRLMIEDKPHYVKLKATLTPDQKQLIVAVSDMDDEMKKELDYKKAVEESDTYNKIAQALSNDYFTIYVLNTLDDSYIEYHPSEEYKSLDIESMGKNFYDDTKINALRVVHPDDILKILRTLDKDNLQRVIDNNETITLNYRVLINGEPVYVKLKATKVDGDDSKIVIGVANVDEEIKKELELKKAREESDAYSQLSRALSRDYYTIYIVDMNDDSYVEYNSSDEYKKLNVENKGINFFLDTKKNVLKVIHPDDVLKLLEILDKQYLTEALKENPSVSLNYRLKVGDDYLYTNLKAMRMNEDNENKLVIGVSNVDAQIKKENEYNQIIITAYEKANKDSLTGVRNKHAYVEMETEINEEIVEELQPEFAIVVLDVNNLKWVNDNLGHKAGDKFIIDACQIICESYQHSPVYRIGGDEFVVILRNADYRNRDKLLDDIRQKSLTNAYAGKVTVSSGMSVYDSSVDKDVSSVFEKADVLMYENKTEIKKILANK